MLFSVVGYAQKTDSLPKVSVTADVGIAIPYGPYATHNKYDSPPSYYYYKNVSNAVSGADFNIAAYLRIPRHKWGWTFAFNYYSNSLNIKNSTIAFIADYLGYQYPNNTDYYSGSCKGNHITYNDMGGVFFTLYKAAKVSYIITLRAGYSENIMPEIMYYDYSTGNNSLQQSWDLKSSTATAFCYESSLQIHYIIKKDWFVNGVASYYYSAPTFLLTDFTYNSNANPENQQNSFYVFPHIAIVGATLGVGYQF